MKNLKQHWNITSKRQLFLIVLVFALTGSSAALITKPILNFLGIYKTEILIFLYYFLYFIILFPIYQILLISIGTLFGQFSFFFKFEIKMLRSLRLHKFADYLEQKRKN